MNKNRRRLIQLGIAGGAGLAVGGIPRVAISGDEARETQQSLDILVLGGTGFIGPHMVSEALRRGHTVSLFNRGRTNNMLFPDLKLYVGDRDNGLAALKGHAWDTVIDNSGYVPRHVADSARLLSSAASHYVYTSTVSVYDNYSIANDEDSPLGTIDDESTEEVTDETYGPLKALCERRAAEEFGSDNLTILRPTYICGPGDRTDRFTYWPVRASRGGDMLWPGSRDDFIQIIDVRDFANFTIDCVEQKILGVYNTVIPAASYTMGELHDDCSAITSAEMNAIWVDAEFVTDHKLTEDRSIPIWAPPTGETAGFPLVSGERAFKAGLQHRPVRETARDALTWWNTLPEKRRSQPGAGLSAEREAELLELWKSRA